MTDLDDYVAFKPDVRYVEGVGQALEVDRTKPLSIWQAVLLEGLTVTEEHLRHIAGVKGFDVGEARGQKAVLDAFINDSFPDDLDAKEVCRKKYTTAPAVDDCDLEGMFDVLEQS